MKIYTLTILFFILSIYFGIAQDTNDLYLQKIDNHFHAGNKDSIDYYLSGYINRSGNNLDKAVALSLKFMTDKAYSTNPDDKKTLAEIYKIINSQPADSQKLFHIYYNLSKGYIYENQLDEALKCVLKAQNIAENIPNEEYNIKIRTNLGVINRDLNIEKESINEIITTLQSIQNNQKKYKHELTVNYSNLGLNYLKLFKKENNPEYQDSCNKYFEKAIKLGSSAPRSNFLMTSIYTDFGIEYAKNKEYKKSLQYYNRANHIAQHHNLTKQYLNNNFFLGLSYFELQNMEKAKKYFNIIKDDSLINNHLTYFYLSKIYNKQNKKDSAVYYSNLFLKTYDSHTNHDKIWLNEMYKMINNRDLNNDVISIKETQTKRKYIAFIVLMIIGLIFLGYYLYKKWQRKHLETINFYKSKINDSQEAKKETDYKKPFLISEDLEEEIINNLKELETKKYFLKSDFNIHNIAKVIDTNPTYLAQAINRRYNKSFLDYTTDLRIEYVNYLIRNEKNYRRYTLQALAQEVGYKSTKTFIKNFKAKYGITPKDLIKSLE